MVSGIGGIYAREIAQNLPFADIARPVSVIEIVLPRGPLLASVPSVRRHALVPKLLDRGLVF